MAADPDFLPADAGLLWVPTLPINTTREQLWADILEVTRSPINDSSPICGLDLEVELDTGDGFLPLDLGLDDALATDDILLATRTGVTGEYSFAAVRFKIRPRHDYLHVRFRMVDVSISDITDPEGTRVETPLEGQGYEFWRINGRNLWTDEWITLEPYDPAPSGDGVTAARSMVLRWTWPRQHPDVAPHARRGKSDSYYGCAEGRILGSVTSAYYYRHPKRGGKVEL